MPMHTYHPVIWLNDVFYSSKNTNNAKEDMPIVKKKFKNAIMIS